MPTLNFDGGVNEREPTLIRENQLQNCKGAEYRVGQIGIFVARGRDIVGASLGVTGRGLYEAGFDGSSQYTIVHVGNSLFAGVIRSSMSWTLIDNLPSGTSEIVGAHYANRHYVALQTCNRRLEQTSTGVTSFPIGMSRSTFAVGVSIMQGVSTMSATTGLVYWVTEYDSARGIESMTGASVSTGPFTLLDGVVVIATGISANPRATHLRWYRSVDGGGWPDGGLIQTTAIGTTTITDQLFSVASLTVPQYGLVNVGGIDYERDEPPPAFYSIFGPFQDSLLGVTDGEPRVLRFTPAGYPDSWPSGYQVPLETHSRDEFVCGVVLPGRIGVFTNDSVQVVSRLPRDSDSVFAAGEASEVITDARGCVSRRGACQFTPVGSAGLAAFVSRDGIWGTNLASSPFPLTDINDWEGRVDISKLYLCRLTDDPINRRMVFIHWREDDTSYPTGIWYLDYQRFNELGIRITYADHGPLADALPMPWHDGSRRLVSLDSRSGNGAVYVEATQDVDDSLLVNSSGAVSFLIRSKEFMPAGPQETVTLAEAAWMHDAGPVRIEHRFYFDRRDDNPEFKLFTDPTIRKADRVYLGRQVNSFSLEVSSVGTTSYGIHWMDYDVVDTQSLGGRDGA